MPAHVPSWGSAIKLVSVPIAQNNPHGLPASTLVLDDHTGAVRALLNATNLTAIRTAAASLLATHLIGPKNPTTILAYGAGDQVRAHLDLHIRYFPSIHTCTIITRSLNPRANALLHALRTTFPRVAFTALSPSDPPHAIRTALQSAQIVITATPATAPLFPADHISPGTHIALVGSYTPAMHEVDAPLLARAGPQSPDRTLPRVLVDSRDACAREAGELIGARLGPQELVELGELVKVMPNEVGVRDDAVADALRAGEVTVYKSVGVAALDAVFAMVVVEKAIQVGVGVTVAGF